MAIVAVLLAVAPAQAAAAPSEGMRLGSPFAADTPSAPASAAAAPIGSRAVDPPCHKTWDGSTGSWFDGGKWSPSGAPGGDQRACLPAGSYTVTLSSQAGAGGLTVGSGVMFVIDGGPLNASASGGTILNRGTIQLRNGADLYANATRNDGVIEDAGTVTTVPRLLSPLDNAGTLRSNLALQVWPYTGGSFNGTITNLPGGTMTTATAGSALTFVNHARAEVTLDGAVANAGSFVQSNGTLRLGALTATGSPIVISGARLDASGSGSGQIRATSTIDLIGDVGAGFGVTLYSDAANFGNLRLEGDRTNRGTLTLESVGAANDVSVAAVSGSPRLTNLGRLDVKPGGGGARLLRVQLTNGSTGIVEVFSNSALTVDPPGGANAHTTSGTIMVQANAAMSVHGCCDTISFTQTAGTITVNGTFLQTEGTHVHQGGIVAGVIHIRPRGIAPRLDPSGPGGPTFVVGGSVKLVGDIHSTATVIVRGSNAGSNAVLDVPADRTNNGTLRLESIENAWNANLSTAVGARLTNAGTFEILPGAGGGRTLGLTVVNQGIAAIRATTVTTVGGPNNDPNPLWINSGTVQIGPSVTLQSRGGYRQTAGSTDLDDAAIYVQFGPGMTDIQGGVLTGKGEVYGPLRNAGEIRPGRTGAPSGRIHVRSVTWQFGVLNGASYSQTASGDLTVEINGLTAGSTYDQLEVDGPVDLAGALAVSTAAGFDPNESTPVRFTVLKATGTRSGTFSDLSGEDSGPYDVRYELAPDAVVLQAIVPPPPLARMSITDAEVLEGDAGTTNLTFPVTLSQASEVRVRAQWSTLDDTASAPGDYIASSGEVVFASGQTQQSITVPVVGDTTAEGVETLLARLRSPAGARLGVARATGTILPDDLGITRVSPRAAGDAGTATLTIRGGGFVPGMDVVLRRTGSPDRIGMVLGEPLDGARLVVRFNLRGATRGDWDVVVAKPGVGGASATSPAALTVVVASAPRIAVNVSAPSALRFGWAGLATVSLRNEGLNDAGIDLVRVFGEGVKVRLAGHTAFTSDSLSLDGDELTDALDGTDVLPPGESRHLAVQFQSTTLVAHFPLKVNAEVDAVGHLDAVVPFGDPDPGHGSIRGRVRTAAGDPVGDVVVTARAGGRGEAKLTARDGSYAFVALPDADYIVRVGPGGGVAQAATTIAAGARDRTLDLTADIADLSGVVVAADGRRLTDARVSLVRDGRVLQAVAVDGAGAWTLRVVGGATYTVVADSAAGGQARRTGLRVEAGGSQAGLRLTTGTRTLRTTVRAGGSPVADARVVVLPDGPGALSILRVTDAAGVASFAGLDHDAATVKVVSAPHAPQATSVTLGPGTTDVAITLGSGATARGTVTADGAPVAGATASVVELATGARRLARSDTAGTWTVAGLNAGNHDVWVQAPGQVPRVVRGLALTAGATSTADTALAGSGFVQPIVVPDGLGGRVLDLQVTARDPVTEVVLATAVTHGRDGLGELGPLPAGQYVFSVHAPGAPAAERTITLPPVARSAARSAALSLRPGDERFTPAEIEQLRQEAMSYENQKFIEDYRAAHPYRDFITQLEEPSRAGHDTAEDTSFSRNYVEPCSSASRLYDRLVQARRAKDLAFDAWKDAWKSAVDNAGADVGLYLSLAAQIVANSYFAVRSAAAGVGQLAALTKIPGLITPTALASVNYALSSMGRVLAMDATGASYSIDDLASDAKALGDGLLTIVGELGSDVRGLAALGAVSGLIDTVNSIASLKEQADRFPDAVAGRALIYSQQQDAYHTTFKRFRALLKQYAAIVPTCPDPTDDRPPVPAPSGAGAATIDNVAPNDPNDLLGPNGVGPERWIPAAHELAYQVRFENLGPGSVHIPPGQSPASAPAVLVRVVSTLDPGVDLDEVELGPVGWGTVEVPVPPGLQSYHADVPQSDGDIVRVDGVLDRPTRQLRWRLETIDPATGDPQSSPTRGFLPPESGTGDGQGHVDYSAGSAAGAAHGNVITALATITFDVNAPIETPTHTNTIDATAPVSAVTAGVQPGPDAGSCRQQLGVSWSGSDVGAGLGTFDVQVATDNGPYEPWLSGTTATTGTFVGAPDHTYAFATVARDLTGQDEALPATPDRIARIEPCDLDAPRTFATVSSPASAVDGWRSGAVTVALDGVDSPGGSGVVRLSHRTGGGAAVTVDGDTAQVPVSAEGSTPLAFSSRDAAGNDEAESALIVRIDNTAPTVDVRQPAEGARYAVGQVVVADYGCADAGVGLGRCLGSTANASALDTGAAGDKTFTVTSVDQLGHQTTLTRRYTVVGPAVGEGPPGGVGAPGGDRTPGGGGMPPPGAGPTPPLTRAFSSTPLTITLAKVTGSAVRVTLVSREPFSLTGRARLQTRGKKPVARSSRATFALKAKARATVTLKLDTIARRAAKRRKGAPLALLIELTSGPARRTLTRAVTLRRR